MNSTRRATILAAVLLLAAAARGQATRPAFSAHDVVEMTIEFGNRFIVDAYARGGRHDPRWDDDARTLLSAQVLGNVADRSEMFYVRPDAMPLAERAGIARRIAAGPCDDAMVLYQAGCALEAAQDVAAAGKCYARANAAAPASAYAPIYQLLMCQADLTARRRVTPAEQAELKSRVDALLRAVVSDRATLPAYRRVLWNLGGEWFDNRERAVETAEIVAGAADVDPWYGPILTAHAEIERAWADRGGGSADDVALERRTRFAGRLKAARELLQKAVEADDAYPQPFVLMINVAKGEAARNERDWFRLALERQCDFSMAYSYYFDSQSPRWGGTYENILEVGREAVATGRFDTRAPAMLLRAITFVEDDQQASMESAELERLYPDIVRCLDGYIERSAVAKVRTWARSARAAWAVRIGRWAEAKAQFDALDAAGAAVDAKVFAELHVDLPFARQRAAAEK